jgi:hypothetical protein
MLVDQHRFLPIEKNLSEGACYSASESAGFGKA